MRQASDLIDAETDRIRAMIGDDLSGRDRLKRSASRIASVLQSLGDYKPIKPPMEYLGDWPAIAEAMRECRHGKPSDRQLEVAARYSEHRLRVTEIEAHNAARLQAVIDQIVELRRAIADVSGSEERLATKWLAELLRFVRVEYGVEADRIPDRTYDARRLCVASTRDYGALPSQWREL